MPPALVSAPIGKNKIYDLNGTVAGSVVTGIASHQHDGFD